MLKYAYFVLVEWFLVQTRICPRSKSACCCLLEQGVESQERFGVGGGGRGGGGGVNLPVANVAYLLCDWSKA